MKSIRHLRTPLLVIVIVAVAMPLMAQKVEVQSYAVSDSNSGTVPDRGVTVSKAGVSIEFSATRDEGYLAYDYRGLEALQPGDVVKIHSHMFVPGFAPGGNAAEEKKLETGDDQWIPVTVKSIDRKGNTLKIELAEPVQLFNRSVRSHGERGKAPAPKAKYTENLRFVGSHDGGWKLVTSPKTGHGKGRPDKAED